MALKDKFFKSYSSENKSRIKKIVELTRSLEADCKKMSDSKELVVIKTDVVDSVTNQVVPRYFRVTREQKEFRKMTQIFRERLRNGETIYDIMPEAFAVCREATSRTLGMFPYDVQIEAAAAMIPQYIKDSDGNVTKTEPVIAEMKTGEGKTLVQILTAYLNALEATKSENPLEWGNVHVFTANDYLARRDCEDNMKVFNMLGLSCGYAYSQNEISTNASLLDKKRESYKCDIVYATASTTAFDYLSDHRAYDPKSRLITKKMHHAIIDEADEILIDQASIPLVLSSRITSEETQKIRDIYRKAMDFIDGKNGARKRPLTVQKFNQFYKDKYTKHQCDVAIYLDDGTIDIYEPVKEEIFNYIHDSKLSAADNYWLEVDFITAVEQCLKARYLFERGEQYKVQPLDDKTSAVILLDKTTARPKSNNKYQGGMQQAVEALVESELEKQNKHVLHSDLTEPLAKTIYPSFCKLYDGISGMTGTSAEEEFASVYGLSTYKVPTRKKNIRFDQSDELYCTKNAKYNAILNEVLKCQKTGQPMLIGTINTSESDELSKLFKQNGIRFQRLDADNSENEDGIKRTTGLFGSITIATNMAGRGIDFKLGSGVKEIGGLYVISTSQNINERVDYQLKGRAARQGSPGKTKCFMSLEDLMVRKTFAGKLANVAKSVNDNTTERITNKKIIAAVKACQSANEGNDRSVRAQNIKKETFAIDEQRTSIYKLRDEILDANNKQMVEVLRSIINKYITIIFYKKEFDRLDKVMKPYGIDINAYKSKNIEEYQKKLSDAILMKIGKKHSGKYDTFIPSIKKRALENIDAFWPIHFMSDDDVLRTEGWKCFGTSRDYFDEYQMTMTLNFTDMLENILELDILMSLDENIKLGDILDEASRKNEEQRHNIDVQPLGEPTL